MTNTKWLVAVATIFLGCTLWCGVCEGSYLAGTDIAGLFRTLMSPSWSMLINPFQLWNYITNFWKMLWFDYAFFHGDWQIVQFAFQCISLALVVSYGALILPSLISGFQRVIGGIAGVFGYGGGA